jgi:hypothetical protein|tara:strand:- start:414 stop:581 length:168 start_codon:yes stop_codon:yes gene_type:complete
VPGLQHYRPDSDRGAARADIDCTDISELGVDFWNSAKVTPPRMKPKGYMARMAAV